MAITFQQNVKFRAPKEQRLDEFDFIGGLVTDTHETKLKPSQSPNLANVIFSQTGSIKKRTGYSRYGTGQDAQGSSADQSNFGASTGTLAIDATSDYIAQTFQPSGDIDCLQVDLSLEMATSGETQNCRLELWSTSGGEPVAILNSLAKSQIKQISGASETTYSFRFLTPISLSSGTTYAVVLYGFVQGSVTSVNEISAHHTGNAYANGSVYISTDTGLTWSADSAKDLKFKVYDGGDTGGTGLIRFYGSSGLQQTLVKFGTTLYRGNDTTGALTAITLGSGGLLNSANFTDHTIANNTLLLVDGANYIQKYRGSTNANYTTGTISVTNGDATVTGSGTSWNTSTNAEVGEYIKLPDSKWYKIASIASDTSLEIEISDSNGGYQGTTLSGQSYTISPWGEVQGKLNSSSAVSSLVRPKPKYIESHYNRIWTANESDQVNRVRWSTLDTTVSNVEHFNDFDTSQNAGTIIVDAGEGDQITGLYSLNGVLYIFQRHATWELLGTSPSNFELRNVSNEIGLLDKRTLVEYDNYIIFLSDLGVYIFDGVNFTNLTTDLITTHLDSFANKTSCSAILWNNTYVLSYTPTSKTFNSETIAFDLKRNIWTRFTGIYAGVWSAWNGGTDNGEIYFTSSNQGSIYQWDIGNNDDGYEISMLYDTPSLGFGQNINTKIHKKFYVQAAASGDYELDITLFKDLAANGTSASVTLNPGSSSLWDVAEWDVDSWSAEGSLITERIADFQGDAKFLKWRFEQNSYNAPTEIFGMTALERIRRLV